MPTPQYTPLEMIAALRQSPRPTTFLRNLFVRRETTSDKVFVEIDIEKGGQKLAAYVNRKGDNKTVGKRGYTTNIHELPYIGEEIPYTADDLNVRLPGNTIYADNAMANLDTKIGRWLGELEDRFIRREEQQIAEALQTGKIEIVGDDVSYEVDFQMDPNHLITNSGAANWDASGVSIIGQLEDAAMLSRDKGAPGPTLLLLDVDAARQFLANAEVQKFLDIRRVEMGQINPQVYAEQRATFLADFRRIGLNIQVWSYEAGYQNANGVMVPMLASNTAILTTPAMRSEMHYGRIDNLKLGSFVGKRFPYIWEQENGKAGFVTMESSPLFGLHQPDAVVRITTKS